MTNVEIGKRYEYISQSVVELSCRRQLLLLLARTLAYLNSGIIHVNIRPEGKGVYIDHYSIRSDDNRSYVPSDSPLGSVVRAFNDENEC